jgi:hypothetical protein
VGRRARRCRVGPAHGALQGFRGTRDVMERGTRGRSSSNRLGGRLRSRIKCAKQKRG